MGAYEDPFGYEPTALERLQEEAAMEVHRRRREKSEWVCEECNTVNERRDSVCKWCGAKTTKTWL